MRDNPRISVVDDDVSVRRALGNLISSVGYQVELFASAEEFLNAGHLHDTDCLILDVRMPGMSGLELQQRLDATHYLIPIIFITAHASDEEARRRALEAGALDFLLKPFSEESLLNSVRAAIHSGGGKP
jgi:FixJ family two-component response regulator